ncbi:MAG: ATP-binding protein [Acidobacteria bacterium]|nr:ATP-binding protein [Acidobacteriota bacterium]
MKSFEHIRGNLHERIQKLREATAGTRGPAPDVCGDCQGTGWVVHREHGIGRASRCECWIRQNTGKLKESTRIPVRYARCAFDDFTVYPNEDLERAFRRAREFAARFPVRQNSLLLAGPSGIGKTHLAAAILNEVADKGIGGLYCETSALLTELRGTYDKDSGTQDTDILRRLTNADLLVIDDLGSEQLTRWAQNMLHAVLNARYNQDLATICTTRLPPDPHERDSLLFEIGGRLLSMLHQMCDVVEFDGADYRHAGDHPDADTLETLWEERRRRASAPTPRAHFSPAGSQRRAEPA